MALTRSLSVLHLAPTISPARQPDKRGVFAAWAFERGIGIVIAVRSRRRRRAGSTTRGVWRLACRTCAARMSASPGGGIWARASERRPRPFGPPSAGCARRRTRGSSPSAMARARGGVTAVRERDSRGCAGRHRERGERGAAAGAERTGEHGASWSKGNTRSGRKARSCRFDTLTSASAALPGEHLHDPPTERTHVAEHHPRPHISLTRAAEPSLLVHSEHTGRRRPRNSGVQWSLRAMTALRLSVPGGPMRTTTRRGNCWVGARSLRGRVTRITDGVCNEQGHAAPSFAPFCRH
jgi:hypothetical protein